MMKQPKQQGMIGSLLIKPLSANLKRDTDTFATMDPYVKIKMGGQMWKGQPHKKGGKHPSWSETCNMRINQDHVLDIEIYDKDVGKDDLVAYVTYPVSKLQGQHKVNEWVDLSYKGKNCGQLLIDIQYFPDGGQQKQPKMHAQPYQQQYPPQQQQYQQQPPISYTQQQQYQQPPPHYQQPPPQYNQAPPVYNQPPIQQQYNQPPPPQYNQQPPPYGQQPPTYGQPPAYQQPPQYGQQQGAPPPNLMQGAPNQQYNPQYPNQNQYPQF